MSERNPEIHVPNRIVCDIMGRDLGDIALEGAKELNEQTTSEPGPTPSDMKMVDL